MNWQTLPANFYWQVFRLPKTGKMTPADSKKYAPSKEKNEPVSSQLEEHRQKIDEIDKQLLHLINQRLAVAEEIGNIKGRNKTNVVDTRRETEVIRKLVDLNRDGQLTRKSLFQIFNAIIAASREIQQAQMQKPSVRNVPALFAVIGSPVSHSLSPTMHNCAFSASGYNGLYLPLEISDIQSAVSGLKALNFGGASITIPHKVSVIEFLDDLDDMAFKIKAVNTVVNKDGLLFGYNTDCSGAITALSNTTPISNKEVVIIGAGGAARAIGFGIKAEGGRVTILNRTKAKGEKLANDLDAAFIPLAEVTKLNCNILVNTTSVGMTPHIEDMCVPAAALDKNMVVMDIVYNPLKTKLLRQAEQIGCTIIDGLSMFIYQGAGQFELWTGLKAPVEMMRLAVLAALKDPG
jgi:shikimate dehydrogenase